jgi:hypothetical protein
MFWNSTFPCDLLESGTMIYLLGCCPAIGWGATIHDLVLDFHVSQFKVHMLWILWQPKLWLGGLDCFALWIILQNNLGTLKSSNTCESSSFPLIILQKICPHTYPHSSCANQLIFMVSGISTLVGSVESGREMIDNAEVYEICRSEWQPLDKGKAYTCREQVQVPRVLVIGGRRFTCCWIV